jgi:catechol 2,3-dioxygenase-like lactoylglutathione lyase family enzyme
VSPQTLDHVALWVAGRDAIADVLTSRTEMRVIERTEAFTLLGADARRGKVTLFDSEGPREPGALRRIGLRVSVLPDGPTEFDAGEGLRFALVEGETDVDYDLDHVTLAARDPEEAAVEWERLGFRRAADGRLEVGGAFLELEQGDPGDSERPLLNHLGVLVESVEEHVAEAEDLGVEVEKIVDAPNTLALFVWGPERVKLEYIEHKPTFSLT